ncbi:LRP2 [Mytilus coruscus]|uniref:LRP2 n=1 Tax=Mytilus coruscus TaxID=42192 RepID=A0A6J8AL81_MYTCO|nr:LRP2 [Mytilus coruscus]
MSIIKVAVIAFLFGTVKSQIGSSCGILYKNKQVYCDDNTQCIYEYQLCDGSRQCQDGSDEREDFCTDFQCREEYVKCADGRQCIWKPALCNEYIACNDGSDESEATCKGRPCPGMKVHCADQTQCIFIWEQCDGKTVHCRDGSDDQENICRNYTCTYAGADLKCADDLQCFSYLHLVMGNEIVMTDQMRHLMSVKPEIVDGENVPVIMGTVFTSISSVTERMTAEIILMKKNLVLGAITDFTYNLQSGEYEHYKNSCYCPSLLNRKISDRNLFSGTSCGLRLTNKQVHCDDNSQCIYEYQLCVGYSQCRDGSDERDDFCTDYQCREEYMYVKYADGRQCIWKPALCNEHIACNDGSDESEATCKDHTCTHSSADIKCADDLQCFSYLDLCDGKRDCNDGSDETFNVCKTRYCGWRQRSCDNGNCVYINQFCNGKDDCGDNSDEKEPCFRNNH